MSLQVSGHVEVHGDLNIAAGATPGPSITAGGNAVVRGNVNVGTSMGASNANVAPVGLRFGDLIPALDAQLRFADRMAQNQVQIHVLTVLTAATVAAFVLAAPRSAFGEWRYAFVILIPLVPFLFDWGYAAKEVRAKERVRRAMSGFANDAIGQHYPLVSGNASGLLGWWGTRLGLYGAVAFGLTLVMCAVPTNDSLNARLGDRIKSVASMKSAMPVTEFCKRFLTDVVDEEFVRACALYANAEREADLTPTEDEASLVVSCLKLGKECPVKPIDRPGTPRTVPVEAAPPPGARVLVVATSRSSPSELVEALGRRGCRVEAIATLESNAWRVFIVGSPEDVNQGGGFPALVESGTPLFVRCAALRVDS